MTAKELAHRGCHVVLACRSQEKTRPVLDSIAKAGGSAEFIPLDLGNLASVRECAAAFLATGRPLHLLINNAGLAGAKGTSQSGFEIAFGTNHVGHFLLTQLLLDKVKESAPARIVTVASTAHYNAKDGIDYDAVKQPTKSATGLPEYAVSKLANVLFSAELAKRLEGTGVTTYSLHPGVVATNVWRSLPWPIDRIIKLWMIGPQEGAKTTLHCALSEEAGNETGLYYDKEKPKTPSAVARDAAAATELWRRSEEWVA